MLNKGFTLIELIIVITIIGILTGVSIPVFNIFAQKQSFLQAVKQVKVVLRDAQNRALAGVKDGARGDWGVEFDRANNTFILFSATVDLATNTYSGKTDATAYALPSGVTFSVLNPESGTQSCIVFLEVSGAIGVFECDGAPRIDTGGSPVFTATVSGAGGVRDVRVEFSGRIYEQ